MSIQSLEYLKTVNLGRDMPVGRRVGVVGGGNSAIDAARVAIRDKHCEKVTILYRRTKTEMPAFPEEVTAAIDEGVEIEFLVSPVKILTKNGRVTGVECIRMMLGEKDASGRRRPVPISGSEFSLELDTLILAIGERPDTTYLSAKDGIDTRKGENIVVDGETFKTKRDGVFAGGDAVTGPNTVVESMGAGRIAGAMIEKYLKGEPLDRTYALIRPFRYIEPVELRRGRTRKGRTADVTSPEGCPEEEKLQGSRTRAVRGVGLRGSPALPALRAGNPGWPKCPEDDKAHRPWAG